MSKSRNVRISGLCSIILLLGLAARSRTAHSQEPAEPKDAESQRILTLEDWRRADDQIIQSLQTYIELNQKKRELEKRLRTERVRFAPEDIGPASIGARREITRISAEYDRLLKESRVLRESVGNTIRSIHASRAELRGVLETRKADLEGRKDAPERTEKQNYEVERLRRWLEGLRPPEQNGVQRIYTALLGEEIGREMMGSARRTREGGQRRRSVGPSKPDAPPPTGTRPDEPQTPRPAINVRIERLEHQHEKLQEQVDRLTRELDQLRRESNAAKNPPIPPEK